MSEFPGNSHKAEEPEAKAPANDRASRPEQVTTGRVIVKKPSLGKRFKGAFVGEDGRSVATHVFWDVIVPMTRDLIADAGREALDRAIYGESRRGGSSSRQTNYNSVGSTLASRVNYGRPALMTDPRDRSNAPRPSPQTRGRINIEDIVLEHRVEAERVIDSMAALIGRFHQATIADLYDLVGVTGEFTDENFGWLSMEGARPHRVADGYRLDLPRVTQL